MVTTTTEISVVTTTKTTTETVTTTSTTTLISTTTVTQTPTEAPSINLVSIQEGKAASWSKTHLRMLIRTESAVGVDSDSQVVDAVGRAVDRWRISITQFSESDSEYSYLGSLVLTVYVQGGNDTLLQGSPDIDIRFTDRLASSLIGETRLLVTNLHSIGYAQIMIGMQDLSLRGLQNVLTHELGHALGLEHSSIEDDLMYSERERREVSEEVLCPSTLDLYALAQIYLWIETESYSPYNAESVTLPVTINYGVLACNQL